MWVLTCVGSKGSYAGPKLLELELLLLLLLLDNVLRPGSLLGLLGVRFLEIFEEVFSEFFGEGLVECFGEGLSG